MATDADTNLQGIRDRLREVATPEAADAIWTTIRDALSVTKRVFVSCPTCKKRLPADVPDASAAIGAAKLLMETLEGRPGVASDAERDQVMIVRHVHGVDSPYELAPTVGARAARLDDEPEV